MDSFQDWLDVIDHFTYDISYETYLLGLTERQSLALQELAQGWVLEKVDTIDSLASKTGPYWW